jgi:ribonuclease BN (tRNA processing enzyme)
MELTVLGSGTCIPTIDRGPSGLALTFRSHLIFFDGGGGSLRQMPRLGLDFRKIDFHYITHFHPDHVIDLIPLLFAMNYTVDFRRSDPLHIVGPIGLKDFYERMRGIFGRWIEAHTYPLYFHEADESRIDFRDFSVETLPMAHVEPSIGFRVEAEGRSLVYSGDTDDCPNIVRLGKEADLLILECSFPEERKKEGHLTPALAGRIARQAECNKLLLTHFYPVFQNSDIRSLCSQEFGGDILLAVDGMKVSV